MAQVPLALLAMILLLVGTLGYAVVKPKDSYWTARANLLRDEERMMIGGALVFEERERIVNEALMNAKNKEIDDGFTDPRTFLPLHNFLLVSNKIRESPVFKIIELMPKGAVLHSHDTAITSSDYIFSNITFRPNLYICESDGKIRLQFFETPNLQDCEWQLLSDLRLNDTQRFLDRRIARLLTMTTDHPDEAYPDATAAWEKFSSIFEIITPLLSYRPVYEDHFYQGLLEIYNDNIFYLELRTTLPTLYELDGTMYGPVEVALIYKKVADRFVQEHPDFLGVKLIYAPIRSLQTTQINDTLATVKELRKVLPNFFAGFDLVGFEDAGPPLIDFVDQIRSLDQKVPLFFHAGETDWYGTTVDENLIDAVFLNSKRIGHGYAILKHPKVVEFGKKYKIAVEVSPISNQILGLVKDLRNHPAAQLFAQDYPVVVSNDDPGLWGSRGLSYDFYEAFMGIMSRKADLRALKQLAINSILYSAMSDLEKKRAMEIWKKRWEQFIDKINFRPRLRNKLKKP